MTKVYMVTSGQYSDYRVVGLFSTEEKAQFVCDGLNQDDDNICDKASIMSREIDQGWANNSYVRVVMDRSGSVQETRTYSRFESQQAPSFLNILCMGTLVSRRSVGSDITKAVKRLNEIRTQYIAVGAWPSREAGESAQEYENRIKLAQKECFFKTHVG